VNRSQRALGAFYGLALGDALGMPTQSLSREQIQQHFGVIRTLEDAGPDQPIAPNMPRGSITDDTEQAILVGACWSRAKAGSPRRHWPRA